MAIQLNDNIKINAGKPAESKYLNVSTPYTSAEEVISLVPLSERHIGLTVNVDKVDYYFKDGITDDDLLIKESGSITGGTNGLTTVGKSIELGGDFINANLNNVSGDAIFQINIGEETITDKHTLYYDVGQFYLQFIGLDVSTRNYQFATNFTADGFEELIFIARNNVQISNPTGYLTLNDGLTIAATNNLADVITSFNLSETGITLTDNRSIKKGIEYAGNYSANFTPRSIVDKGWVTANTLTNINPIKTIGANYTVTSNDINYIIEVTGSTNRTITFPSGLTNGFNITINNLMSSNTVTIVAGSGTTLNLKGSILATQYDGASLYINNNFIRGFGNLT